MSETNNNIIESLCTRRSIRRYKPEQITDSELQAVLNAGMYAPTGMNRQDPWIVAVQNPSVLSRLTQMNAAIMGTTDNPYYDAPTVVLVFASSPESWRNSIQDASLVLGNMMNAAHAIGLGSCWINREAEMFMTDEGKFMMKEFGLPDGLVGVGAISLGYPDGEPKSPKPRKEGYCRVIK